MKKHRSTNHASKPGDGSHGRLRIIGGELRSRIIEFTTDTRTRPMKDRTREAVFNLVGGSLEGYMAFDFFAGSGVLALESLSRGATHAIAIELRPSAAREISLNAERLGVADKLHVIQTDAFDWIDKLDDSRRQLDWMNALCPNAASSNLPWCVFICPPYQLWETRTDALQRLVNRLVDSAPPGSLFAVELDASTSTEILPIELVWQTRLYRPALMAIGEKEA